MIEKLIQKKEIEDIDLTLFETDSNVAKITEQVIEFLSSWLKDRGIRLKYEIKQTLIHHPIIQYRQNSKS